MPDLVTASAIIRVMPVDIRLTYEDYCRLPSDGKRYEIIEGELFDARYGVQEYWIIDPYGPSAEIYRRQQKGFEPVRMLGATDSLTSPLFPGFSLPLKDLVE